MFKSKKKLIIVGLSIALGLSVLAGIASEANKNLPPDDFVVKTVTKEYVETQLNYPASSKFSNSAPLILRNDDGSVEVHWEVDAANGFGALERKPFILKMEYVGGRVGWQILSFAFIE